MEDKKVSKKNSGDVLTPYIFTRTSHTAKVGPDRRVSIDLDSLCMPEEMNRCGAAKPIVTKVLEQIKMSFEPAGICHGSPMTSDPCSVWSIVGHLSVLVYP